MLILTLVYYWKDLLLIYHNLFITLLMGFATETMSVKQLCYMLTKMYMNRLYRTRPLQAGNHTPVAIIKM